MSALTAAPVTRMSRFANAPAMKKGPPQCGGPSQLDRPTPPNKRPSGDHRGGGWAGAGVTT